MAKTELKYYSVTARGHRYNYAWRGGPRLYAEPGTDAFVEELHAIHVARKAGDKTKMEGLVIAYRRSDEYRGLSAKTRKNWAPWLGRIEDHFGKTSLRAFDRPLARPTVKAWRDKYRATPRAADVGMQVLSRVCSWGIENGWLATNPCSEIPRLYSNDRSEVIWTQDDLKRLAEHASPEIMWAARLGALTGMRQAMLLKLAWEEVHDLSIETEANKRRRGKRAKIVVVPLYGELRALLKEIPRRAKTVLTTTRAKAWGSGFGASWQGAIKAAGIDKHFHDLRGTAATRFYVAGLTTREIAVILGWSDKRVEELIDRYVKKDELLKARILKLDQNEPGA